MNISPARTAAFDILMRIETERAFSSVLLPLFEKDLSPADRSLCHELVLGVLRRQMLLDSNISALSSDKKLDIEIRIALRLALYQLHYLDKIPAYSAINESVNLVQRAKKTSAKGFVNAVLRRSERENAIRSFTDEIEQVSVETSHPRWLIDKWSDEFGLEKTIAIAKANNEHPQSAFRLLGSSEDATSLAEASIHSANVVGCYIAARGEARLFELAERREIYIQDEASQMVARSVKVPAGGRFLDVCAAPGGKTGLIAREFPNASLIAAGDNHWPRVEFLRENCRRQAVETVNCVQFDAEQALPFEGCSFDAVLVDAPCSGTGTIRRNPEIRYFLEPHDLAQLPQKQLSILTNASKLVRSGGSLVYSTCSLEREENEGVCEAFLLQCADFTVVKPNVPDQFQIAEGFARTWPHRDGMDGFFVASFRKE